MNLIYLSIKLKLNIIIKFNYFKSINLEFKIFFYEPVTLAIPIHFDILPRSLNILRKILFK
jgi:hypothetical protein